MRTKFLFIMFSFSFFIIAKTQSFKDLNSQNVLQFLTSSQSADIGSLSNVIQLGDNNLLEASLIDDKLYSLQMGNNNVANYIDYNRNQMSEMTIRTIGNNNIIVVDGSNSISNGMSVEIIGSNKSIFIENR
ncbi:hypothetical protein [Chryseobacterium sp. POL2]|uniref:hypothetical protein n=1 Tax=Chryseobacterium sp. POL2 TaxID=2713414 RepID=UPI0013E16444|nr:hypothetical protein [Chryseobacterium sp. POL2]QIG89003.1 hypothetical protein G6R40_04665 [Chryseobacterium sp. POL2]